MDGDFMPRGVDHEQAFVRTGNCHDALRRRPGEEAPAFRNELIDQTQQAVVPWPES